MEPDLLTALEAELQEARRAAAAAVDRAAALAALRQLAIERAARLRRPLRPGDLFPPDDDERGRAEVQALLDRVTLP